MDPTQLAKRKEIIATTLQEIRSKSKKKRTNDDKTQLNTLSPYENASDEKILAITQDEWNSIFPNDQGTTPNDTDTDMDREPDSENNEGVEPEGDGRPHEEGDNDESEDEFQGPAPRPTRKRQETPETQRWNDIEAGDSDDPQIIDQEALSGFSADVNTNCTTVGKTRNKFINAYGEKQYRIYKLEDFSHYGCDTKKVSKINGEGKQLGMIKNGETWMYGRENVAGVYGIAFADNINANRRGAQCLDPGLDDNKPWTATYIWIGWRDPNDPNKVRRSWETRSTARRLWRRNTDILIYYGACEAQMRYESTGERVMSRDGTPDLIQKYMTQLREESVGLDVPRQSSVPAESIISSIETGSSQNQPKRNRVQKQPSQATASFDNQYILKNIIPNLESLQRSITQLADHFRFLL